MCAAVVVVLVLFADLSAQQMDSILNAIKMNTTRMVITIPMKYGVESCVPATISVSVKEKVDLA